MINDVEHGVYWAVIESSPDGVVLCDDSGRIVVVNHQTELLFGWTREELTGQPVEVLLPRELQSRHIAHRTEYLRDPTTRPMGRGLQLYGVRRDGSPFPVDVALSTVDTAAGRLVVATVRDVSGRIEIEMELADQRTKATLAEERERIARDLHDTVVQRLFADGLTLQSVLNRVDEPVREKLQSVLDDHDNAIREIRTTILALGRTRPSESGLRRSVIEIVEQTGRILGFRPSVRLDGALESRLDPQIAGDLLATLREALSNTMRHAEPTSVSVEISAGETSLVLRVTDNGRGIDPARLGAGNGLVNLRRRATELGGTCAVEPRPGGGTIVEWTVPMT